MSMFSSFNKKTPAVDESDGSSKVVQVAVGAKHALLLTDEGIVYSWGSANNYGQLGRTTGEDVTSRQTPLPIVENFRDNAKGSIEVIVQIACGLNHCLALSQSGKLYAWGNNKAGQLGLEGWALGPKNEPPKSATPQLVVIPGDAKVKSISCGPESSACVTIEAKGGCAVYVWGAVSYYLFQEGRKYTQKDNCTIPVKLRGMPPRTLGTDHVPDQVAIYKDKLACTVSRAKLKEELEVRIESLKKRATLLQTAARNQRLIGDARADGEAGVEQEDLKGLNEELNTQTKELGMELKSTQGRLDRNKEDLTRVYRELTICDQQDTAYNEKSSEIEVKKSEQAPGNVSHFQLESQLNDINQFRTSNRKNKMAYLSERDRLEQEQWKLKNDFMRTKEHKNQADARLKLLKAMEKGDFGNKANSTVDDGLRIASSKREELAATFPQTLAGAGRFTGFLEALSISERALQDVSSALKEVSAVVEGGDGTVLEEVLEVNLKLRKEYNQAIYEKLATVDPDVSQTIMGSQNSGLLHQFFKELQTTNDQKPKQAEEDSSKKGTNGMFGFKSLF